jgi:hypothetical protein
MAEKILYQCDLCTHSPFKAPTALGRHKRAAHGVLGKSHSSIAYRNAKAKEVTNGKQQPTPTPEPKKRGRPAKVVLGSKAAIQKVHHNQNAFGIPEGALAVAFGRFQELCRSFAFEYDLPPKLFTTRLSQLISASAVR